jgi:hypothetical protein
MNRAGSLIIAGLLIAAVLAAVVLPRLGGDDKSKGPTRVQVAGLGSKDKADFFSDSNVKDEFAKNGLSISYTQIEDVQISHALRFDNDGEGYDFVWTATDDQTDAVLAEEPSAKSASAVSTRVAIAAYRPQVDELVADGIVTLGKDDTYSIDLAKYAAAHKPKIEDNVSSDGTPLADFLDADGLVQIVRVTEQDYLAHSAKLPPDAVLMYPTQPSVIEVPLLTMGAGGEKVARLLRENKRMGELLIKYGWRTGDDVAFRSAWKSLIVYPAVKKTPADGTETTTRTEDPNIGGPLDVCPNIDGAQAKFPEGMTSDAAGDCVPA